MRRLCPPIPSFLVVSLILGCLLPALSQTKRAPARAVTNRTTPAGWRRQQFIEAGYSISLPPGATVDKENNVRLLATSDGATFKDQELIYDSHVTDDKLFPKRADAKQMHEQMLYLVQNSHKGENRTLKPIVHLGVPGYEFEYEAFELASDFSGRHSDIVSRFQGRYFIIDNQVYSISVMYKRSRANLSKLLSINQRIKKYLDSLEWLVNPEKENYGVLDNYVYTNRKLGFSIKFNPLHDTDAFWYFVDFGVRRPMNWTKDMEPVGFTAVPERDGSARLLSALLVTAGGEEEKCLLTLKLVRAAPGSDAKAQAAALQRQIAKEHKIKFTRDIPEPDCKTFAGQPGCGFAFNDYDDARKKAVQQRFYVIKLSETTYLRLDWAAYDKDLERQIEDPLGEFRILK